LPTTESLPITVLRCPYLIPRVFWPLCDFFMRFMLSGPYEMGVMRFPFEISCFCCMFQF
jgi:hypothetical protein